MWNFHCDKDYASSLESLVLTPENTANTSVNYDLNYKKKKNLLTAHYQVLTFSIHNEAVDNSK